MTVIKAGPNRARSVRHICPLHEPKRDALMLDERFNADIGMPEEDG